MASKTAQLLAKHLGNLSAAARMDALPDRELLERFAAQRDEEAFAALVRRHGPMVLRVCRRVLHDAHAAEDVFQATFLVLSRKAASLQCADTVSCFLHGVASRLALKARAQRAQQGRERLRVRLSQRGLTLPAALLAVLLTEEAASAAVPALLLRTAMQTATAGPSVSLAPHVAVLAESALQSTTALKTKVLIGLLLLMGGLTMGVAALQTKTDSEGRFEMPRVPPIPVRIWPHLGPWKDANFRSGPSVPRDLKPGQRVELALGGGKTLVQGKVKLTGKIPADLDCTYSLNYLVARDSGITPPPEIARLGFDARNGWRDAWSQSQEGLA